MITPHPLDILFLTNFSDFCFRAIPSIAQIGDSLATRLTLMHAYDPDRTSEAQAMRTLESFYPEADRYRSCRRVVVPGPLLEAVGRHLAVWPVNLIVAPTSDPIGVPRIGERSLRARLIEECGVPVWTLGRRVPPNRLGQPVRNLACWLDFHEDRNEHLPFAIEYAHRVGATLHLLRVIPPIHEGSLVAAAHQGKALHPAGAAEEISRLCNGAPIRPQIHVSTGEGRSAMIRLLNKCDADLVFLRNDQSRLARWLGVGLRPGDRVPCPAVYVGGRLSVPVWHLEAGPGARAAEPIREVVKVANRTAMAGMRNGASRSGLLDLGLL